MMLRTVIDAKFPCKNAEKKYQNMLISHTTFFDAL